MPNQNFDGIFDADEENLNVEISNEIAEVAGIAFWQVHSIVQGESTTKDKQTEVDSIIPICTNISSPCCSYDPCECKSSEHLDWMIDSGASLHFTGDINDFVEYTPFEQVVPVDTANSTTSIEGKGTVILLLASGEYVRIYPVHYVPDMKVKLLSLGTFLRAGHQSIGTAHFIKVLKNGSPFLNFVPRRRNDSIYVIRACVADETDLHYAIDSVYNVDYDIVHKRLGHPSKDVIQKARKHLKDFPKIEVPTEDHICPGCAQGKMTNRSFPPTQ